MSFIAHIVHLLFPHASNNHRAKILHPAFISFFAIFVLFVHYLVYSVSGFGPAVLGYAYNIPIEKVMELTNKEREKAGLNPLQLNAVLSNSATQKARDMFEKNYWAHIAPDGTQPWKFFSDAGYEYRYAGENLARDFSTPEDAVKAWMASKTHKENLLSRRYKEIGIGVVDGKLNGVETTLIVQHFGTQFGDTIPKPSTPTPVSETTGASSEKMVSVLKSSTGGLIVSPLNIMKKISGGILIVLAFVLVLDIFIIKRANIIRLSSKSLAHVIFLGMILVVVIAQRAGWIL